MSALRVQLQLRVEDRASDGRAELIEVPRKNRVTGEGAVGLEDQRRTASDRRRSGGPCTGPRSGDEQAHDPDPIALSGQVGNTELNGSVSDDRRPRVRGPRRPDSARRARTARRRQRDDQRARRALRHVADRDEEAHPAARGGEPRRHGEGWPCPQMHTRARCLRGHQHVAAAARPLRAGCGTHERSTMNTTVKKGKRQSESTNKKEGFTAEEKAAMKARARELKDKADGESAVRASIAAMSPQDRAIAKRLHELIKAAAPDLSPKTWYGMPAYAKDGKVVCFFRNAGKFKERYAMFGFNDSAKLDEGSMWPVAFALTKLTAADEAKIRALVKKAVG